MSMRIDGQAPQPSDAESARRLESAKTAERAAGPGSARASGSSTDRVEVSPDALLVAAAIRAADEAPAVRPEAVERGRRALESGTLGQDTGRLADRMIASLLGE